MLRAQDIMSVPVVTVAARAPAKQAVALLSAHGLTTLPVVDDDERLIGLVTAADLRTGQRLVEAWYCDADSEAGDTVAQLMTSPCLSMSPGTDLSVLARALLNKRVRAMPIVDGPRVIGIVTQGDIIRTFARADAEIAADVRHHLAIYGGPDRWQVEVRDGNVRIVDSRDDKTDRHVAILLAEVVPGVVSAHVSAGAP